MGAKGTVTLDVRFDCGYFVTVHVGRQEFQGMLYYPPQESAEVSLPATKCNSVLFMIITTVLHISFPGNLGVRLVNRTCVILLHSARFLRFLHQ